MGIQLTWDNAEQTALRCAFDERWTWDEADATMLEVKRITDSSKHEIDAIIDLSKGVNIPGSIFNPSTMQHARKMLKMGETNGPRGVVVVVSTSSLIRTIYNTVRGMDKDGLSNVTFADTLEQARAMLKARQQARG